MDKLLEITQKLSDIAWGTPLIVILLVASLYLTIKLRGIQITKIGSYIKAMFKKDTTKEGEVSSFGALCIALSATIGTGNIVGVATSICLGGPGALFWLVIGTILGLSLKYAEGFLAIKYRKVNSDKTINGGPFAYIEYGFKEKHPKFGKALAIIFAIIASITALFGIGTLAQVNSITEAIDNVFLGSNIKSFEILGKDISIVVIIAGIIITVISAIVIFGGIKRLTKVCTFIVPVMAVIYISSCFIILLLNIASIPSAIILVIKCAFVPKAVLGSAVGFTFRLAIKNGIAKGLFSSEAGLGSAPIALATSNSNSPVEQGMSLMGGTLVTLIICTMTGLAIILTNSYQDPNLEGINTTILAFQKGLPIPDVICSLILLFSIFFFAFTTIIGWNMYGIRSISYVTKNKTVHFIYQIAYILTIFIAPYLTVKVIWNIADITCALMVIPNLIAIVYLANEVSKDTSKYFKNRKNLKIKN